MRTCQVCGKPNTDDSRFCFSCGASLSQAPPVKVDIKSPLASVPPSAGMPPMHMGRQAARSGSCYYHPDLPSTYVCSRCGRSICVGCNKQYGILNFCPECYWGLAPKIGAPQSPYQTMYQPVYQVPPEQNRWPF